LAPDRGWLAGCIHLGDVFQVAWNMLRCPASVCFLLFALALVCYIAPNVEQEWKWITPESVGAVIGWIVISLGFAFCVNNFRSYSANDGSIGVVTVLLTWMYVPGLPKEAEPEGVSITKVVNPTFMADFGRI
jgi:membrane protein